MALALYESQLCPSGHWLPEAAAAEHEFAYRGRNTRCHACTAAGVERKKFEEAPTGLLVGAELKPKKRG